MADLPELEQATVNAIQQALTEHEDSISKTLYAAHTQCMKASDTLRQRLQALALGVDPYEFEEDDR